MTTLNKQSLINLLIDSPLREAIKINLVDIVNNTNDADLDKTYSTISKELEIYQKATERRLKLAGETIAQLSGAPAPVEAAEPMMPATSATDGSLPPLPPLPPMPPMPAMPQAPVEAPKEAPTTFDAPAPTAQPMAPLQVPPLDLPPMPVMSSMPSTPMETPTPVAMPTMPATEPAVAQSTDDDAALAEIQKELDALKNSATSDASAQ